MAGGGRHQGVVARVDADAPKQTLEELLESLQEPPLLLVLDGITDPHNLGACLRVANAAGAHAVIAPKDHAAGINATVSKVASGAAEITPYFMVTNLARTLADLKDRNIWIVGADDRARQICFPQAELPGSIAWVLGAEGEGMRRLTRETCDLLVRIPMGGAGGEPERLGGRRHLPVRIGAAAASAGRGLEWRFTPHCPKRGGPSRRETWLPARSPPW